MISVEVKGGKADRFRAYAVEKLTRKPNADDHRKAALGGRRPLKREDVIYYDGEGVAFSGEVSGSTFTIKAGDKRITRVVLYHTDDEESEVVVGSADVGESGNIQCELVDPDDVGDRR